LNHSAPFQFQGGSFYGYALHLSQKVAFEGDISYFFTKNFALELSANAPTQQNLSLATVGKLGTIDLMLPMLIAQYHFVTPKSQISPYVGLGMSWNHIQSQDFSATGNLTTVTRDTSGFVIQVGLDFPVSHGVYVNLDYRHVQIIPNLKDGTGNILTDVNITPNIFSIGFGYRF
jgi:outer membrane protein W